MVITIDSLSSPELLALHARIMEELRKRDVLRSSNNPVADLAELLFCRAFSWEPAPKSNKSFDASDGDGSKYEVKGRRPTRHNKSRQLSAIRDLPGQNFDTLAAVLFNEDYTVMRAALIPHPVVMARAPYVRHTNSYRFVLRDDVWEEGGVRDVTAELRGVNF